MVPIDLFFQEWPNIQRISCLLEQPISESTLTELQKTLTAGNIGLEFIFTENGKNLRLTAKQKIDATSELFEHLESLQIKPRCVL